MCRAPDHEHRAHSLLDRRRLRWNAAASPTETATAVLLHEMAGTEAGAAAAARAVAQAAVVPQVGAVPAPAATRAAGATVAMGVVRAVGVVAKLPQQGRPR